MGTVAQTGRHLLRVPTRSGYGGIVEEDVHWSKGFAECLGMVVSTLPPYHLHSILILRVEKENRQNDPSFDATTGQTHVFVSPRSSRLPVWRLLVEGDCFHSVRESPGRPTTDDIAR